MKSISEIHAAAASAELLDVLHELVREEELRIGTERKPGGAYTRWSNAAPADLTKARNYEVQTARLHAGRLVLATMSPEEFKRRLFAQTRATPSLFV
jgi:hypothetical protein